MKKTLAAPTLGLMIRHGEVSTPFGLSLSKPIHLSTGSRRTGFKRYLAESIMALGLFACASAMAESGPYLALDAGRSSYKDVCTAIAAPLTCDDTGTLLRIAGGYNFAQMWGMFTPGFEIGYADLGEAKLTGGSFNASALQVEAAGSLAVGGGFSIIAKLGFSRAKADLDAGAQGFGTPGASSSRNNGACAIGALYDFNDRIGVRAQYENLRMFGESVAAGETNIRAISAGLVYRL